MMTRLSFFQHPSLLGFDHLERMLDEFGEMSQGGYPPYNIEQLDDHHYQISIAVAGFSDDDLDVTFNRNQLTVSGKKKANGEAKGQDKRFLHQGIAAREFERRFVLAEGIEVTDAHLDNGLLTIELVRPQVEESAQVIPIKKGNGIARGIARGAKKALPHEGGSEAQKQNAAAKLSH